MNIRRRALLILCFFFLCACDLTPAMTRGIAAYHEKRFEEARDFFISQEHNPTAQIYLFKIYRYSERLRDPTKALVYLQRAADSGDGRALELLARTFLNGDGVDKDTKRAHQLFEAAVAKGQKSAYAWLSEEEEGDRKTDLLLRSAGSFWGDWRLADFYSSGRSTQINAGKAFEHMAAAADRLEEEGDDYNSSAFRFNLARYYFYGFGTKKDLGKAYQILTTIQDEEDARALRAWLLFWGEGVAPDQAQAVEIWLALTKSEQERSRGGTVFTSGYALTGLSIAFAQGKGVPVDVERSKTLGKDAGQFIARNDEGHFLLGKYNSLGFLDGKCDQAEFRKAPEAIYSSLYLDYLMASYGCLQHRNDFLSNYRSLTILLAATTLGSLDAKSKIQPAWARLSREQQSLWLANEKKLQILGIRDAADLEIVSQLGRAAANDSPPNEDKTDQSDDYARVIAMLKSGATEPTSARKWSYKIYTDEMTSKPEYAAQIIADSSLSFHSPYEGINFPSIVLKKWSDGTQGVVLAIKKGQFHCGSGCTVSIRFDEKDAKTYRASPPNDGSSNYVFIEPSNRFIAEAKRSQRVAVKATFYQEGDNVMIFRIGGLHWD
jgi:TPR repeat protein